MSGDEGAVPIYVGATEEQLVPALVLEHSIRKHASLPVRVQPLCEGDAIQIPAPRSGSYTTFSLQRFTVPERQAFRGRALYLDSDMIVFQDIRALWELPSGGAPVLAPRRAAGPLGAAQLSVLVLDCGALSWDVREIVAALDRNEYSYDRLMRELAVVGRIATIVPASWNSLERYEPGTTALLHFTRVETQPWLCARHPLAALWLQGLFDALDGGSLAASLVDDHVQRRFLRPSLLWQIRERVADCREIPRPILAQDAGFEIPRWRPPSLLRRALWFLQNVTGRPIAADTGARTSAASLRSRATSIRHAG